MSVHRTDCLSVQPGLRFGWRPENAESASRGTVQGIADRVIVTLRSRFSTRSTRRTAIGRRLQAHARESETGDACDVAALEAIRRRLRMPDGALDARDAALCLVAATATRVLGLTARPCQLEAAWWMLDGRFVELATGEGKTLSTGLAASITALAGTPVHVVTANDYLAARDAAELAPLYAALGLSSGAVTGDMDSATRRARYSRNVVHVTGKQLAFDDLRDALHGLSQRGAFASRLKAFDGRCSDDALPMLPGLCCALVDEADAVLVDDARLPLVLAVQASEDPGENTAAALALAIARSLREGRDFVRQGAARRPALTEAGRDLVATRTGRLEGSWRVARYRDERVRQALVALHALQRDRDYIVCDGTIVLIDSATGRPAPDRSLQHGLHRMVELKERCRTSASTEVRAATSFQRFFARYHRLAGTSGTLAEVRNELLRVYGCPVVTVERHRTCRLHCQGTRVFRGRGSQLQALVDRVHELQSTGRPVLIGTASVEQSAAVSLYLSSSGVACRTLDASQSREEADIVASAGSVGQVTVATRMAGRGTDIPLGEGVAALGGLHVIILAVAEARRLDRQLSGRAARGGDPGSTECLLSLDDPRLVEELPAVVRRSLGRWLDRATPSRVSDSVDGAPRQSATLAHAFARVFISIARSRVERRHASERLRLYLSQPQADRRLAVAGQPDTLSP